jgi:hypothetical protein
VTTPAPGSGWAFSCGGAITRLDLLLGGTAIPWIVVTGGVNRPDVRDYFVGQCPSVPSNAGFSFILDPNLVPPGTHLLQIRATDDRGLTVVSSGMLVSIQPAVPLVPEISAIVPGAGPTTGGTPVQVIGTNFLPGARLLLGGVDATNVVVVNGNTIQGIAPPHGPGLVDTFVVNPNSHSDTLPASFVYSTPGPRLYLANLEQPSGVINTNRAGWGWAFSCGGVIINAEVLLNGIAQPGIVVTRGVSRPDVQAYYQAQCPSLTPAVGLTFTLTPTSAPAGFYNLQIRVTDDRNQTLVTGGLPVQFNP